MTYTVCKQLSLETSVEKQTLQLCLFFVCVCVESTASLGWQGEK